MKEVGRQPLQLSAGSIWAAYCTSRAPKLTLMPFDCCSTPGGSETVATRVNSIHGCVDTPRLPRESLARLLPCTSWLQSVRVRTASGFTHPLRAKKTVALLVLRPTSCRQPAICVWHRIEACTRLGICEHDGCGEDVLRDPGSPCFLHATLVPPNHAHESKCAPKLAVRTTRHYTSVWA